MGPDTIFEEAEGDGDQDWCPDDPWTPWNDAVIDRMREERAFND